MPTKINVWVLKAKLLNQLLNKCSEKRNELFSELLTFGNDETKRQRRYMMLSRLAELEAQLITKIYQVDVDDENDLLNALPLLVIDVNAVTDRSS